MARYLYKTVTRCKKIVFIGDTGEAGEQFKEFVWKNLKDNIKAFKVVNLKGLEQLEIIKM